MADKPNIGRMRWPVLLARRIQVAAGETTISERLVEPIVVRADIQPLGPMTFLEGAQTDRPITHRVYLRWLDWIDLQSVIVRRTERPDHTVREEIFRVRKVGEYEGRKRFVELLVELESRA